jgi:hypothetical protein
MPMPLQVAGGACKRGGNELHLPGDYRRQAFNLACCQDLDAAVRPRGGAMFKVVARDGIEPPTPAFSGPRSTTELSGLGKPKSTCIPIALGAKTGRRIVGK